MEVARQEATGRSSRSRRAASNKENICPLQRTDSITAEVARRRSPLPEDFPRSPLQDITHIICPHNIWPVNEDPLIDQVCKKFRRDNTAESCMANGSECGSSWKGLATCMHVKLAAKVVETEVATKQEISKWCTDVEAVGISNESKIDKHEQDLCIFRDEVPDNSIALPNCKIEGKQDAKSNRQSEQVAALDMQTYPVQHQSVSVECGNSLKQSIVNRSVQTIVLKGNCTKRWQQSTQSRKKSSLSMFR